MESNTPPPAGSIAESVCMLRDTPLPGPELARIRHARYHVWRDAVLGRLYGFLVRFGDAHFEFVGRRGTPPRDKAGTFSVLVGKKTPVYAVSVCAMKEILRGFEYGDASWALWSLLITETSADSSEVTVDLRALKAVLFGGVKERGSK